MYSLGTAVEARREIYNAPLQEPATWNDPSFAPRPLMPNRSAGFGPQVASFPAYGPSYGAAGASGMDSILNAFGSFVQSMFGRISQMIAALGGGPSSGAAPAAQSFQFFSSADASSVGDPHDAFSGSLQSGGNREAHWDDMHSHGNLLSSDSFAGGFRIATQVGPATSGATKNARATVLLDDGATAIAFGADGSASIASGGGQTALVAGCAVDLGSGRSALLNNDGSLAVTLDNGRGGSISSVFTASEGGVDVRTHAANVDLGGYLVERDKAFSRNILQQ